MLSRVFKKIKENAKKVAKKIVIKILEMWVIRIQPAREKQTKEKSRIL